MRKIDLLADIFGSEAAEFKRHELDRTVALCRKHRHAIASIAEGLAEQHELSGNNVRHLFYLGGASLTAL
jgi:hypothetical protein